MQKALKISDKIGYSAFNPETCVFVSANAGSGKTSLLANRVISLLLHGVEPSKILCLTFTNAAAAEMKSRILKSLGSWVIADEEKLIEQVSQLTNEYNDTLLARARSLFASVLESPQGINIQTIHGFSQSILRRFPLEADISPYFSVMDSGSEQEILKEARLRLFSNAHKSYPYIDESLASLAKNISESGFNKLINEIVKNKSKFRSILQNMGNLQAAAHELFARFKLSPKATIETLLEEHFSYQEEQKILLRQAADILLQSDKDVDTKTGKKIADWLAQPEARKELLDGYIINFLTEKNSLRKTIFSKQILPETVKNEVLAEQQRVYDFYNKLRGLNIVQHSVDVLCIAQALLAEYEAIKRSHAWMDYDDLVFTACNLLTRTGISPWVLFKLDGGIDHILVDEAQDTNPQQWKIVDAITQEFFAGKGAKENIRSLFIVGDEKQSIFSFQGADVKVLEKMHRYFAQLIIDSQKEVHSLALTKSYRSVEAILKTVDAVFARPEARLGVTFDSSELNHIVTRNKYDGLVELWPVIKNSDEDETNFVAPTTKMVRHIADNINSWIKNGEAKAGDIMILLRRRTTLADKLVRALKRRGVAVAGSDRMKLNDNLAVEDLIALGQILLLPDDDLTLASCLKSPIFNVSEEDLYSLANNRGQKNLWQRLGENEKLIETYQLIVDLRARADFTPPFELYSYLLNNQGAKSRFIGRMGEECADPIDEFLQQALLYEQAHAPSLQGFIHWLIGSKSEIKRDMEQARDAVRIMTVHGAKGLQAKIVILPDTIEVPNEKDSLLWIDNIPVRSMSAAQDDDICKSLKSSRNQDILSEYRRLLYVALTRAEDRLYIFGATGKDKINEQSWYHHIKTGMESIATKFETSFGEGLRVGCIPPVIPEKAGINLVKNLNSRPHNNDETFLFLHSPAPVEPTPNKPLVPSQLLEETPATASPLSGRNLYAAGKFIHSLLQYLPEQAVENRKKMAAIISQKFISQLPAKIIEKAIQDVLAIIENQKFAFLFGNESIAEVPVTGIVEISGEKVTVSGQIDRLYLGSNEVWIVDFKSNSQPPALQKDIPIAYIRQLALYRLLLQKIIPEKPVYCALLWTATAKLDVLPDAMLDEWKVSS